MNRPKGTKNRRCHMWSDEEKEYLKEITPGRHYKEIQELMIKKFECVFSLDQIKGAIYRYRLKTGFTGQFTKGHVPANKGTKGLTGANKTSFKKGQIPVNYRPVGSERVNIYGYVEIKVADPNRWRLKHRVVYEQHHGPISSKDSIIFADGNKLNLDINNLILVSKQQLLVLNRYHLITQDADLTKTSVNVANIILKINEVENNK